MMAIRERLVHNEGSVTTLEPCTRFRIPRNFRQDSGFQPKIPSKIPESRYPATASYETSCKKLNNTVEGEMEGFLSVRTIQKAALYLVTSK